MYLQYSQFKIHPYFGNTFGHLGYLYGSIEGIKPTGIGMPRIFTFFTSIAPVILAFYLFFFSKELIKKINPVILLYLVSFLATFYSGFFLVKYFDRYLLLPSVLILFLTTLLLSSFKINKILLTLFMPFLFLNFYISYLFSWEFVLINNYVWQESTNLVQNQRVPEDLIYGNGAWIEKYNTKKQENCIYVFNYDPKFSQKNPNFRLVNVKTFNYLKPAYPNLKIYLYEKTKS